MPDKSLTWEGKDSLPFQRGSNHLFVIGIDQYQSPISSLHNARRDAERLVDLLTTHYQFEPERVTALYDQEASLRNMAQAFREKVSKLPKGDNLLVYFSGHGHYAKDLKEGYWIPANAELEHLDTYLPYSTLQQLVAAGDQLQHILIIADACYSGAVLVRSRGNLEHLERDPSRWIIASGRNELVSDGDDDHSPFAQELFQILERHQGEGINCMALADRLTNQVAWNAQQTPIGQPMQQVGHRGGQFVFRPKVSTTAAPESIPSNSEVYGAGQPEPSKAPVAAAISSSPPPPIKEKVLGYVRKGRTEASLPELEAWILQHASDDPEQLLSVIAIQGDAAKLRRDRIRGLLTAEAERIVQAGITRRVLELIRDFP